MTKKRASSIRPLIRPLTLVLVLVLALPTHALAQPPTERWKRPPPLGKRVFVITNAGDETAGRLEEVTPDGVVLTTATGTGRTIPFSTIRTVQRTDPAWTGLLIGAGAGVALGLSLRLQDVDTICPQRSPSCEREVKFAPVQYGIGGGLLGWGLDALYKGRKTFYSAGPASRARLTITPQGIAVRAVMSF
jgi:hypothetical protein